MKQWKEQIMRIVFMAAACVSIAAVILICVFLFANGLPAIREIGWAEFLWEKYGGLPITSTESFR